MLQGESTIKRIYQSAISFEWSNTIGIARSLLAAGLFLTFLFNDLEQLIYPLGREEASPLFTGSEFLKELNLFRLLDFNLLLAENIAMVTLLLVVIGWRPRITCILHWWVTFSYATCAIVLDGGDQIAQVLTLLLIPICLTDSRKWHWKASPKIDSLGQKIKSMIAWSTLLVIQLQVALIYFHAAIGKMRVEEWMNGTSLFYWIQNPTFGLGTELEAIFIPFFAKGWIVTPITWGTLLFELILFMALIMSKKHKKILLPLGILFHLGIILLFGLFSFFFIMSAALLLYLGPKEGFSFLKEKPDWFYFNKEKERPKLNTN